MRFAGQVFTDPVEDYHKHYDAIPSFGVKPAQKGLQFAFPAGTNPKFYENLNNPIQQPAVEKYIYNRHIFDEDNPFPIT